MNRINVALLGAGGQLGKTIVADWLGPSAHNEQQQSHQKKKANSVIDDPDTISGDFSLHAFTRSELDICDPEQLGDRLRGLDIQVIVNAAAYTRVDEAESDQATALAVNRDGARNVAEYAVTGNCHLIHVSTDFVFNGSASRPYRPGDATDPLSVYGKSKLAGEQAIQEICAGSATIVRTGWLYSAYQGNFMSTMLRLMQERDSVGVVSDQVGTPTSARSLARFISRLVASGTQTNSGRDESRKQEQKISKDSDEEEDREKDRDREKKTRIYHWSDAGVASWYDFAVAIQEEALAAGLLSAAIPITPIKTTAYPTPAARPGFSVLDKSASYENFSMKPVHWRRELRHVLEPMNY